MQDSICPDRNFLEEGMAFQNCSHWRKIEKNCKRNVIIYFCFIYLIEGLKHE